MAKSTYIKTDAMGSILFEDNTPTTKLTYTALYDNGDIVVDGLVEGLREIVKHERKGNFVGSSYGARIYPSFSFSAKVTQFTDAVDGTLTDMLLRTAGSEYAAAIGTLGTGRPYTLDVTITVAGTKWGDAADHTFTLHDVRFNLGFSEGESDTINVSGEVLGAITGDIALSEAAN